MDHLVPKNLISSPVKETNQDGFTLVEVSIVLAILSSLTALAVPNVVNSIKLARIDEAKALMNFSAAQCLQAYRLGKNLQETTPSISNERLEAVDYKLAGSDVNCTDVNIEPRNKKDTVRFAFGYKISNSTGDILKIAIPARNKASYKACLGWAGENCGVSEEMKAEWARIAKIEADKAKCASEFSNFKNSSKSGKKNRWDSRTNSCTNPTWVFEGRTVGTEEAYKQALKQKYGECLTKWVDSQKINKITGVMSPPIERYSGDKYYFSL